MSQFVGFDISWAGADGSEWDLRRGPVQITEAGIKGLGFGEFDEYSRTPPLIDGQVFAGTRQKPRTVFLPLLLGVDTTDALAWLDLERRWWRSVNPDIPGTLTVTAPDGLSRSVGIRFIDDAGQAYTVDPALEAMSVAGLNMRADNPWWLGPEGGRSFDLDANNQNFFGGPTGFGPPFFITSSNPSGSWTLENPGDVDAWPVWVVKGPAVGFSFVVDGQEISGSLSLPAGYTMTIDTNPTSQVVLVTDTFGNDSLVPAYALDNYNFARVPHGSSVPVTAIIYGSGSASVQFQPRYYRAW